jgi:hypothetical protein
MYCVIVIVIVVIITFLLYVRKKKTFTIPDSIANENYNHFELQTL